MKREMNVEVPIPMTQEEIVEVPIPMTQEEIAHWALAPFDEHVVEPSVDELFCATVLGPPVPIGP